jgi:3-oxoacyl-[acyl-carrier-protein] synthase II
MRMALAAAGLNPSDIDYVAAHGTSTPKNDTIETAAIKIAFGEHSRRLPVSSNKAQVGHTIAGAAVTNLICGTKAITESVVPPTMHYRKPDPECDLDYVPNQPREMPLRTVMANSFAFGGQNLVLVVRAFS